MVNFHQCLVAQSIFYCRNLSLYAEVHADIVGVAEIITRQMYQQILSTNSTEPVHSTENITKLNSVERDREREREPTRKKDLQVSLVFTLLPCSAESFIIIQVVQQ